MDLYNIQQIDKAHPPNILKGQVGYQPRTEKERKLTQLCLTLSRYNRYMNIISNWEELTKILPFRLTEFALIRIRRTSSRVLSDKNQSSTGCETIIWPHQTPPTYSKMKYLLQVKYLFRDVILLTRQGIHFLLSFHSACFSNSIWWACYLLPLHIYLKIKFTIEKKQQD